MTIPPVRRADRTLLPELDQEYCSGAFSDELDRLGLRHQVAAGLTMNRASLRTFGRVRTLRLEAVETDDERIDVGLGFLGQLEPGDVLVVQGSHQFAYFGELMTRLALRIGLAGVVIDGLTRDSFFTQTIDLPIFSRGHSPVDIKGRGRVVEVDLPVRVGEVACHSGDYVFGDSDAIVVIPKLRRQALLARVEGAARHERNLKSWIADGMSISEILTRTAGF